MTELSVRAMSPEEFDSWQDALTAEYAREHVSAGNWAPEEALDRAREANAVLLPLISHQHSSMPYPST